VNVPIKKFSQQQLSYYRKKAIERFILKRSPVVQESALTPQLYDRIVALFIDNLTRYRNDKPLRNIVDKNAGY